ncbi:unnamed protein product, partial [Urochloa humidicola]
PSLSSLSLLPRIRYHLRLPSPARRSSPLPRAPLPKSLLLTCLFRAIRLRPPLPPLSPPLPLHPLPRRLPISTQTLTPVPPPPPHPHPDASPSRARSTSPVPPPSASASPARELHRAAWMGGAQSSGSGGGGPVLLGCAAGISTFGAEEERSSSSGAAAMDVERRDAQFPLLHHHPIDQTQGEQRFLDLAGT